MMLFAELQLIPALFEPIQSGAQIRGEKLLGPNLAWQVCRGGTAVIHP